MSRKKLSLENLKVNSFRTDGKQRGGLGPCTLMGSGCGGETNEQSLVCPTLDLGCPPLTATGCPNHL